MKSPNGKLKLMIDYQRRKIKFKVMVFIYKSFITFSVKIWMESCLNQFPNARKFIYEVSSKIRMFKIELINQGIQKIN